MGAEETRRSDSVQTTEGETRGDDTNLRKDDRSEGVDWLGTRSGVFLRCDVLCESH